MPNPLKGVLERLRATLSDRTEQAYSDRDDEGATNAARDFAAGEAHAYGTAEGDVRAAKEDPPAEI